MFIVMRNDVDRSDHGSDVHPCGAIEGGDIFILHVMAEYVAIIEP